MKTSLIVARSYDNVIGIDGKLPWDCPADLASFKEITSGPGKAIAMGRKTWDSLPRKPLPRRLNIVISSSPDNVTGATEDVIIAKSIDDAVQIARNLDVEELIFIGGKAIYDEAVKFVDEVHLSEIEWDTLSDNEPGGERVYFDYDFRYGDFDPDAEWSAIENAMCLESGTGKELFTYLHLVRK